MKPLISGACSITAATCLLLAVPASAGEETWNFGDGSLNGGGNGNVFSMNVDGIDLEVTGWSDTDNPNDSRLESGELRTFGSTLGLENRDEGGSSPGHSFDSFGNDFDAALLSFSQALTLDGFSVGWAREDYQGSYGGAGLESEADISVLAYTGTTPFSGFSSTDTWAGLLSQGWELVSDFADVQQGAYQATSTSIVSNNWLISAYNPAFGGGNGWTTNNEGFKLAGAATSSHRVPAPGTLALLALGLLGVNARRSRGACATKQ